MSDLKTILKEYKQTYQLATDDLSKFDFRTRPGREMLKNQAVEKLDELKDKYLTELKRTVFLIFPTGSKAQAFAELAEVENAMVVDASAMYVSIATKLRQSMTGTSFTVNQFFLMNEQLRTICETLEVDYKEPEWTNDLSFKTFEELVDIVRNFDEATNGQTIVKAFLENLISFTALQKESTTKVNVVVVLNEKEPQKLANTLSNNKKFLEVNTDKEEVVDTNFVIKTFEQIKKIIKGTN